MRHHMEVRIYLHCRPEGDSYLPAGSTVYGSGVHPVNLGWVDIYDGALCISVASPYTVRHMPDDCGLDFVLEGVEECSKVS